MIVNKTELNEAHLIQANPRFLEILALVY
ncbi:hypothetical protein MESS4_280045 [Mesorhizobium sp. STM 4661]|nr:hypothetical protein MESS4_280045 [Mesorhizobium sp. STM 4661]